jgi:hypothetical protein
MLTLKCIVSLTQIHRSFFFQITRNIWKWFWNMPTYKHTRNRLLCCISCPYTNTQITQYFISDTTQRVRAISRCVVNPWTCCAVNKQPGVTNPVACKQRPRLFSSSHNRTREDIFDINSTNRTYSTLDLPVRRQSAMKWFSRFGFAIAFWWLFAWLFGADSASCTSTVVTTRRHTWFKSAGSGSSTLLLSENGRLRMFVTTTAHEHLQLACQRAARTKQ